VDVNGFMGYLLDEESRPEDGKRPTGWARPQRGTVRRPGIRFSGFEGEGANQGAVSRPKRSFGRVTATIAKNESLRLHPEA